MHGVRAHEGHGQAQSGGWPVPPLSALSTCLTWAKDHEQSGSRTPTWFLPTTSVDWVLG